tara:strand:+ start:933 stop:1298 length:366 start_codon:yes stop_codon:yes gene_type:complete
MKPFSDTYKVIISIVFGFLVINEFVNLNILKYIIIFICGIAVFSSKISQIIVNIWFFIAKILSQIIPNIILVLIFYILLCPLAVLWKFFNRNNRLNYQENEDSFYTTVKSKISSDSFKRAW